MDSLVKNKAAAIARTIALIASMQCSADAQINAQ